MKDKDRERGEGCGKPCRRVEVPTEREKEALDALRRIKQEVRRVKQSLAADPERADLRRELGALRAEWGAWRTRQEEAARERMVLLGHEDPDGNALESD